MKLIADERRAEPCRNEAMHLAWARVSFEGCLREEQLAIERHLEPAAAARQQHRPGDPRRPPVEELSHQTGGSTCVVSDDAELDLKFMRSVGRLGVHARTLRCDACRRHPPTPRGHGDRTTAGTKPRATRRPSGPASRARNPEAAPTTKPANHPVRRELGRWTASICVISPTDTNRTPRYPPPRFPSNRGCRSAGLSLLANDVPVDQLAENDRGKPDKRAWARGRSRLLGLERYPE